MKFLKFIIALLLVFLFSASGASAYSDTERINWFFKPKGNCERPEFPGIYELAKEHNALFIGNEGDKTVYLTFDAGYSNENVEKTIDVLKKHNIKAAFFILPGIIKNSPETVQRMIDDGHLICNHTTSHKDMSAVCDIDAFESELTELERIYREKYDLEMEKYFRPPEGSFSIKTLEFCKSLGYTPVFWSFAYRDWDNSSQPDTEKAKAKILDNAHDGMVILLHPTSLTNALILDEVICELSARGYSFGTLDELKSSAENQK